MLSQPKSLQDMPTDVLLAITAYLPELQELLKLRIVNNGLKAIADRQITATDYVIAIFTFLHLLPRKQRQLFAQYYKTTDAFNNMLRQPITDLTAKQRVCLLLMKPYLPATSVNNPLYTLIYNPQLNLRARDQLTILSQLPLRTLHLIGHYFIDASNFNANQRLTELLNALPDHDAMDASLADWREECLTITAILLFRQNINDVDADLLNRLIETMNHDRQFTSDPLIRKAIASLNVTRHAILPHKTEHDWQVIREGASGMYINLNGARLREGRLIGAKLSRTTFTNADLTDAYLQQANLSYAALVGTHCVNAHLQAANLAHSFGQGLYHHANLSRANLQHSAIQFRGSFINFEYANFMGARFYYTITPTCIFVRAKLSKSKWSTIALFIPSHNSIEADGKKTKLKLLTECITALPEVTKFQYVIAQDLLREISCMPDLKIAIKTLKAAILSHLFRFYKPMPTRPLTLFHPQEIENVERGIDLLTKEHDRLKAMKNNMKMTAVTKKR